MSDFWICETPKCKKQRTRRTTNPTESNPRCEFCGAPMVPAEPVASAELAALRAALAEARRPKTCAGCKHLIVGVMEDYCNNDDIPGLEILRPDDFGCIHWEPAEPAPATGGGEGG